MPKLAEVCRDVRSKNAGPFWITVDLFFQDKRAFEAYAAAPELSVEAVAPIFGVAPSAMKRFALSDLDVVKFSFPRAAPQGGRLERDMHGGQQYVPLLQVDLREAGERQGA